MPQMAQLYGFNEEHVSLSVSKWIRVCRRITKMSFSSVSLLAKDCYKCIKLVTGGDQLGRIHRHTVPQHCIKQQASVYHCNDYTYRITTRFSINKSNCCVTAESRQVVLPGNVSAAGDRCTGSSRMTWWSSSSTANQRFTYS